MTSPCFKGARRRKGEACHNVCVQKVHVVRDVVSVGVMWQQGNGEGVKL